MFRSAQSLPPSTGANVLRQVIPVLERILPKIQAGDESGVDLNVYSMVVGMLGFCQQHLGNASAALDYYSRGLQIDPYNNELLLARGMLLYGSSPRSISDFTVVAQRGSEVVWPYLFLAHDHLIKGRFEECRKMSERAMRRSGSSAIRSELAEWLAICQAELGFPAEMVRASFEDAIRLDPSNDRARQNLAKFEKKNQSPATAWEMRTPSAVHALGQAEWMYAHAA